MAAVAEEQIQFDKHVSVDTNCLCADNRPTHAFFIAVRSLCIHDSLSLIHIFGVIKWGWYMDEIAALFLGMSFIVAVIARMGFNNYANVCLLYTSKIELEKRDMFAEETQLKNVFYASDLSENFVNMIQNILGKEEDELNIKFKNLDI